MGNNFLKSTSVYKARDPSDKQWDITKIRVKNNDMNVTLKLSRISGNKLSGVFIYC